MNARIVFVFGLLAVAASGCAETSVLPDSPVSLGPIPASAEETRPLSVGSAISPITLQTMDGKLFDLNMAVKKQPAIIMFYRGGWCPYCNTHLGQLQKIEPKLRRMGYQVLAVSPDRPGKGLESVEKHALTYTLLSDHTMRAARAFGIAFRVDDATLGRYKEWGIDLEASSGESHHLLPVPAVFIVGTDGIVKFSHADPDYKVRLAPKDMMDAAQAALKAKKE